MTAQSSKLSGKAPAAAASLLAAAAGVLLTETLRYPGPTKLYPSAVLIGAIALSVLVAVRNLRTADVPSERTAERQEVTGKRHLLRPALFTAVWLGYPFAMYAVGFLGATWAATGVTLWLLRIRHPVIWSAGALPGAALLLIALQVLFNVTVPQAGLDLYITDFVYSL